MDGQNRKLDRMAVRELAEKNSAELLAVAHAGGNVYQRSLEQQDRIDEIVASLSIEEATAFSSMYADELNACTQKTVDDTNLLVAKAEAREASAKVAGEAIGGVIALVVFIGILIAIFK